MRPGERCLLLTLLATSAAHAQIPLPAEARYGRARFDLARPLQPRLSADADPRLAPAAARTLARLQGPARPGKGPVLQIRHGRHATEERYSLRVTTAGVLLDAPGPLGILRGLATLEQLPAAEGTTRYLPEVDIRDQPRFAWRGLLLDAARHFMPLPVIKRNLDGMAATKLNVLHWHLSDDQGWRVESRLLPRLHTVGGATGYYTQAEVREVVQYAAARGIRVVPEFDLPGHTGALLAAYPRVASNDSIRAVPTRWGVLNLALDPTRETTYAFLDSVLTEMSGLFPDPCLHLGGDENDGRQWRHNPRIVAFMREKGLVKPGTQTPDKHQLQTYFNRRMLTICQRLGKTMVGWDEILGPDLPRPVVIESWRGSKGVLDAVRLGHPALRAHGYYLDLNYTAAAHYAADPEQGVPDSLRRRVLGGEAAMWSEFADSVVLDSRIWPRAAAVAERLWSPAAATQGAADLYRRLPALSEQLEGLGLRHRRAPAQLLARLAQPDTSPGYRPGVLPPAATPYVAPLTAFAALLEPVKEYKRHFQGFKYSTATPLTRLVDAAPAESETARRFALVADSLLAGLGAAPAAPATRRQLLALRLQLTQWQALNTQLQPLFAASPGLQEYAPLAENLALLAARLLERLTQLETRQTPIPLWRAALQVTLDATEKPAGQAELAPALRQAAKRLGGV